MAILYSNTNFNTVLTVTLFYVLPLVAQAGNFEKTFRVTWGNERVKVLDGGKHLSLTLDRNSGSGFESKGRYLYGKFEMKVKLVPGNSAGTVTTLFLASGGPIHDEIDWEFLGNVSGEPYTIHTNVYSQGKGDREQQFRLWFDPTTDFHTYSITWNPLNIIFTIDGIPIRQYKNMNTNGVPYPTSKPMKVYASLWNADDWATQGGRVKTDWNQAPFVASYSGFRITACKALRSSNGKCIKENEWKNKELNSIEKRRMKMMQRKYMIYDYCTHTSRFPQGFPPECKLP